MAGGDVIKVDVPDPADARPVEASARGLDVVGLEDGHIAALAIALQEALDGCIVLHRPDDFEELVANRKDGVLEPELRHARVGKGLAEIEHGL